MRVTVNSSNQERIKMTLKGFTQILSLCIIVFTHSLIGNIDIYKPQILAIVKETNGNQMTYDEYLSIAEVIDQRAPCNLLIFGVGHDSQMWCDINRDGQTFFLEDSEYWLNFMKTKIPSLNGFLVKYETHITDWQKLLESNSHDNLLLKLPETLSSIKWDIILVDGPAGNTNVAPGRMSSIYTSMVLAKQNGNTDIFVHDCNRPVEKSYCDTFLGSKFFVKQIHKLRHYHIHEINVNSDL